MTVDSDFVPLGCIVLLHTEELIFAPICSKAQAMLLKSNISAAISEQLVENNTSILDKGSRLTREQLIQYITLVGCDYVAHVPYITPKKAFALMAYELFYCVKPRDTTQDAVMQVDELKKASIKAKYKKNFHAAGGIAGANQQCLPYSSFDEWMEALEKARNVLVDPPCFGEVEAHLNDGSIAPERRVDMLGSHSHKEIPSY